ncbi:hypothetical protein PVAND_001926 [Polypedilum vanderplanki]|uniref:Ionotropic receptor n=1 Tax=Polypedilum vanderplanki TaxID=319348 RepID=A0A9J6BPQ9_POLVA|nr:hypothetical protein PVAND_001926 [Polypedilum vanderplanki]
MEISTIIFLILIHSIQSKVLNYNETNETIDSIATTTANGIFTVCEHRDLPINIILPSTFSKNVELQRVFRSIIDRITVKQVCNYRVKSIKELKEGKMRFSLFIIDAKDIKEITKKIVSKYFNFRLYFIIVLLNGTEKDIQIIFDDMWKKFIFNINIVHCCRDNEALITTFMPFHSERCSDTAPVELNKSSDFFPDKMKDLHNCPIIVATSLDADPCVYAMETANGSSVPAGSDVHVIETLSNVLNFSINYIFTQTQGYLDVNGSAEGPFKLLVERKAHLAFDCYWLTNTRIEILDSTSAYYNDYAIFVVPPGKDLTAFEKLLYPFSWNVWIVLCACIFIGLILIYIVKFHAKKKAKIVVFGEKNQSPAMNLLSILLVGNQHIFPRNLFARLLLLNFLIFTLNMRTLYQGAMFEFMQSNKKHDEIKSIDEMKENNFPVYVLKTTSELFIHNENINKSLVPITSQYREQIMNEIEDSYFKGALIMAKYKILTRNFLNKGKHQLTICKDRLMSISIVMYSPRNFYLIDKINEKISLFSSAGLLQYWHIYDRKVETPDDDLEPTVLTMQQLHGLFQLTLFGYFHNQDEMEKISYKMIRG